MVKPQKSTDVNDEISPTSIAHEVNDLKSALASFAAMIEDFRHENGSRFVAITNKLEDVDHKTATLQTSIGDLQDDFQAIKKFNSTIQSEFDDTLKLVMTFGVNSTSSVLSSLLFNSKLSCLVVPQVLQPNLDQSTVSTLSSSQIPRISNLPN